ncbi:hypothetical protein E2562_002606 [Oryza meyeriana var. granulata]|uniref:Uncharacterized protein n=1 Tax=Oryza meyeriana var. granulata TaxID=110450 RepID=A0A6G1F2X9_9ORYZ|nr:hypothetical protein E2562_002606 [Oryza meyeriana var. granulata]
MAPNDAGGVAEGTSGPRAERVREPVAPGGRRDPPTLRLYAFQIMLLGATAIIGCAYAAPVSLPRLFQALVIWLVGCLSLFMARA